MGQSDFDILYRAHRRMRHALRVERIKGRIGKNAFADRVERIEAAYEKRFAAVRVREKDWNR